MHLIDLVRKLVDNPDEREAFQANPEAYITLQEERLRPHLRDLQTKPSPITEVGTVFHIRKNASSLAGATINSNEQQDDSIPLTHVPVIMTSHAPFFAEYKDKQEYTFTCTLLKHSYIHIENEQPVDPAKVAMLLHLCFVDPQGTQDQPQVLTIQTEYQLEQDIDYNLGNTVVFMNIPNNNYVLLRGDPAYHYTLTQDSTYNKITKELSLVFDKLSDGSSS